MPCSEKLSASSANWSGSKCRRGLRSLGLTLPIFIREKCAWCVVLGLKGPLLSCYIKIIVSSSTPILLLKNMQFTYSTVCGVQTELIPILSLINQTTR